MSLMSQLRKNSKIKDTEVLSESRFFNDRDQVQTDVPALNIAFSGRVDGGLGAGLTVFAGPSKHFKTAFALTTAKAYLDKFPESVMVFYDSEFGSPQSYFSAFGIDSSRVLHTPIKNIEELKFDVTAQLELIDLANKEKKKGEDIERVIFVIDSLGNLASKKEIEDAKDEKSVADMTRAKTMKSVFRIVTPYLQMNDIPMIAINHTYQEIGLFPKAVVSGGCVVEGTMIQTPDGLKAVEDFNVGEEVITLDGNKVVTHVWNPDTLEDGEPECYEVEFEDGYKVTCSDKHKFLIDGNWVEAKDLVEGDDCVIMPRM